MRIAEIDVEPHIEQAAGLLSLNWAETGFDFPLNPDWESLTALQRLGALFVIGAFDGDNMIGYSTAYIAPHPFNPAVVVSQSSALFVRMDYRCTSAGARLIVETERVAKARGARIMAWHTRAGTSLAETMTARGYVPADSVVTKEL